MTISIQMKELYIQGRLTTLYIVFYLLWVQILVLLVLLAIGGIDWLFDGEISRLITKGTEGFLDISRIFFSPFSWIGLGLTFWATQHIHHLIYQRSVQTEVDGIVDLFSPSYSLSFFIWNFAMVGLLTWHLWSLIHLPRRQLDITYVLNISPIEKDKRAQNVASQESRDTGRKSLIKEKMSGLINKSKLLIDKKTNATSKKSVKTGLPGANRTNTKPSKAKAPSKPTKKQTKAKAAPKKDANKTLQKPDKTKTQNPKPQQKPKPQVTPQNAGNRAKRISPIMSPRDSSSGGVSSGNNNQKNADKANIAAKRYKVNFDNYKRHIESLVRQYWDESTPGVRIVVGFSLKKNGQIIPSTIKITEHGTPDQDKRVTQAILSAARYFRPAPAGSPDIIPIGFVLRTH